MIKKIITICLAALQLFTALPSMAKTGDDFKIVLNEVFDNYASNETKISGATLTGIDARIVDVSGGNKAAYAKIWGKKSDISFPIANQDSKMGFSFDIKIDGDPVVGTALTMGNELFNFNQNRSFTTRDGYYLAGYSSGKWMRITAMVNFTKGTMDVYIDGKMKIADWRIASKPSKPKSCAFSFKPADEYSSSEVYLDNLRVWTGDTVLNDNAFPKKEISAEVREFTPTAEVEYEPVIYIRTNGATGLSAMSPTSKDNSIIGVGAMDDGRKAIHVTQGSTSDCFADFVINPPELDSFVYEASGYIESLETGTAHLGYITNSANAHSFLFYVDSKGMLYFGNTAICEVPFGEWFSVQAIYNIAENKGTVYYNRELVGENLPIHAGAKQPYKARIYAASVSTVGDNEFWVDKIRLYEGKKLIEFEEDAAADAPAVSNPGELSSIVVSNEETIKALGKDIVYAADSDYLFANGGKINYSTYGTKPFTADSGEVMVPENILDQTLGLNFSCDGATVTAGDLKVPVKNLKQAPVKKSDVWYYPIAELAKQGLKEYVYTDNRNFVLLSNENRAYSNSLSTNDNIEAIDDIYRYMQFERPNEEMLYNDVKNHSYKQHPRIFIKKDEIPALRAKVSSDPELREAALDLIASTDRLIGAKPQPYFIEDGLRLFSACLNVRNRLMNLATCYLITDDKKYADRAWEELQCVLEWKDWNLERHFLDSGKLLTGVTVAYDVFYDYFTPEQREYIRRQVEKQYINYAVGVYTGSSAILSMDFRLTGDNWGAVCGTSMLYTGLCFMDEEDPDCEFSQKCKFLAVNAMRTLEYAFGLMAPDGAVLDGIGYWEYFVEHTAWSLKALTNMTGKDYGFKSSQGYNQVPYFGLMVQTPGGGSYNYSKTTNDYAFVFPAESFLIADLYGEKELMPVLNNYRKALGIKTNCRYILWYEPQAEDKTAGVPLDKYFIGQDLLIMRESNDDSMGSFVGVKAGQNTMQATISHRDKGSFIYEAMGERWFVDAGHDSRSVIENVSNDKPLEWMGVRAEAHNLLLINPSLSDPGQEMNEIASLVSLETKPKGAVAVFDLQPVYKTKVSEYKRGFLYGDDRNTLIVQDELTLTPGSKELYWLLNTKADDISISSDKKSAALTQNGKQLKVEFYCSVPDYELEVVNSTPIGLDESPISRENTRVLRIRAKAEGKVNIAAKFLPQNGGSYPSYQFVPMNEWTIPNGECSKKPELNALMIDGEPMTGFAPGVKDYDVEIPYGSSIPVLSASTNDGSISITQPTSLDSTGVITLKKDGVTIEYKVNFKAVHIITNNLHSSTATPGIPDNVQTIEGGKYTVSEIQQSENPPEHLYDNNFDTRWACSTSGCWIELDLGEKKDLSGFSMSYMYGTDRTYFYQIMISDDNIHYTVIYDGQSSNETNEWDYLPIDGISARYIRYIGTGNSANSWNSITEFRACTYK